MWNLEKYRKNIAFITDMGEKITYSSLISLQQDFVYGIKERSLIFIICTNTLESIIAYVSSMQHGIVPVMLDCCITKKNLYRLLKSYMPQYIYAPVSEFLYIDGYNEIRKDKDYILYKLEKSTDYEINDKLALLLPTSGSTGSSKYVKLSYENIMENMKAITDFLCINENDRTITSLPICYAYGLSVINTYLYAGASIVLTEKKIIQPDFWKLMRDEGVTAFSGVPYMYKLCRKINAFSKDFPELKVLTQAGGKLDLELQKYYGRYCDRNNKKFYIMYGQTEATARMSYLNPNKILTKLGSIGTPIKGGEFELYNESGEKIIKPCQQGEIVYKGKNVSMGYSCTYMDLSKCEERKGVLYTGDYGYFDNEGFWYVTGRKDKYAKLMGKRIDLSEMEHMLSEQYGGSYVCSISNDEINILGDGNEKAILNFVAESFKINKGILNFYKQKIRKWKET